MPSAITWPALTWEPQTPWVHRDALASRRATRRNSGTFSSAVPASIAELNIELSPALRAASPSCPPAYCSQYSDHAASWPY